VPPVPPAVNRPFDPVNPPIDPVLDAPRPIDPVLDPPPPIDPFLDPTRPIDPFLDPPPPDPALGVGRDGARSDHASLNVPQPAPEPEPTPTSLTDQLAGLDEVVDDLLPPRRGRR
jgi:hypothetical protein